MSNRKFSDLILISVLKFINTINIWPKMNVLSSEGRSKEEVKNEK
jgi:hypothetical protein